MQMAPQPMQMGAMWPQQVRMPAMPPQQVRMPAMPPAGAPAPPMQWSVGLFESVFKGDAILKAVLCPFWVMGDINSHTNSFPGGWAFGCFGVVIIDWVLMIGSTAVIVSVLASWIEMGAATKAAAGILVWMMGLPFRFDICANVKWSMDVAKMQGM